MPRAEDVDRCEAVTDEELAGEVALHEQDTAHRRAFTVLPPADDAHEHVHGAYRLACQKAQHWFTAEASLAALLSARASVGTIKTAEQEVAWCEQEYDRAYQLYLDETETDYRNALRSA